MKATKRRKHKEIKHCHKRVEKLCKNWSRLEAIAVSKVMRYKASAHERDIADIAIGDLIKESEKSDEQ